MLHENIKVLRKAKGLSQETLALRLNVVRQTVSKWEKGLSVPDAEMLIRIAEELDTPVSNLLGETIELEEDYNAISQQLAQLNTSIAERNRRARRIWKTVAIVLIAALIITLIIVVVGTILFSRMSFSGPGTVDVVESMWMYRVFYLVQ